MLKDWHVVGAKVICLDNRVMHATGRKKGFRIPDVGPVYTVRDVSINSFYGHVQFRLVEIVNPFWESEGDEPAFGAFRFRPVVSRKTDISCFEKLLTSPEVREMVELVEKVG